MSMDFREKLSALRKKMANDNVGALIISSADPHQSPSVCAHWKAVQWLTGFTGSLSTCIVSRQSVAMWTDGRYLLQAQRELNDKDIEIYISSDAEAPSHAEWIREHIGREEKIAIDKKLFSVEEYRSIKRNLGPGFIVEDRSGYVDETWQPRPLISSERLFELDVSFAGASRVEKINIIRGRMKKKGAEQYLAASLDAVAWLTNLRGHDNPIYPLFHSYLFITGKIAVLYTNLSKIDDITAEGLRKDNILLRETSDIFNFLPNETAGKSIYLDPYKISVSLFESLSPSASVIEGIDLITHVKSMKNEIEQKNIRMSNIKECVALCRLIKSVKENVKKEIFLDEYMIGQKVNEFRKIEPTFLQPANIPIVAVGENAALPHYKPKKEKSSRLEAKGFLLFDLCAHYLTGSTDITRTIQIGCLSDEMQRDYTLVLKAHIALATLTFPYGTTGFVIDGIVKSSQWRNHMNYDTGTGHGIGFCLDIHEGPCKIVNEFTPFFPYAMTTPLDVGMLFSNEPGVYKKGRFGVRLENDILVQEDCINEFGRFLKFETLTYCPFELGAIKKELLSVEELEWLNKYHEKTYEALSPYLNEKEKTWLWYETRKL